MNCGDVPALLQSYSDGELDLIRQVQMEDHLAKCHRCAAQVNHLGTLRAALSSPSLYYRAPDSLRTRIPLAEATVRVPRRRPALQLAALAAGVLLLIGTVATLGMILSRSGLSSNDRLAERVIASHVRSLQVDHLTDVASTDQHTVKPWFRGQLDYSPQVPDLTPQGFALTGGRLDYLTDRPVAALVYFRRQHAINVFTWPATSNQETAIRSLSQQGFHLRYWQRAGMAYWAISDLKEPELDDFVRLFQDHSAEQHP